LNKLLTDKPAPIIATWGLEEVMMNMSLVEGFWNSMKGKYSGISIRLEKVEKLEDGS